MQLRVVPVEADQHPPGVALVEGDEAGLHALEGREVPGGGGGDVHAVDPPVLIAAPVLDVEQRGAVVRPGERADAPVAVVGDHRGRGQVVHRSHPHVEHPAGGGEPPEVAPVGGQLGADALGIPEQDLAGDQGHVVCRHPVTVPPPRRSDAGEPAHLLEDGGVPGASRGSPEPAPRRDARDHAPARLEPVGAPLSSGRGRSSGAGSSTSRCRGAGRRGSSRSRSSPGTSAPSPLRAGCSPPGWR